jgi:hypothetical protein
MVMCIEFNKGAGNLHTFCSFEPHNANIPSQDLKREREERSKVTVADVAKAITTPPIRFKPFSLQKAGYVDGSYYLRNPSFEVFQEITKIQQQGESAIDVFLSLGTTDHISTTTDLVWKFGLWSGDKHINSKATKPAKAHEAMEQASKKTETIQYLRFEVPHIKRRRRDVLKYIEEDTAAYLKRSEVRNKLQQCARKLVEARRARAQTRPWEAFALGIMYFCRRDGCKRASEPFATRRQFLNHLVSEHQVKRRLSEPTKEIEEELDRARDYGKDDYGFEQPSSLRPYAKTASSKS